jgi:hypothetical protein
LVAGGVNTRGSMGPFLSTLAPTFPFPPLPPPPPPLPPFEYNL